MLTCIPPKSSGDIYVGTSSGYKPVKVIYGDEPAKIAVTYNHDISTWDTDADIVLDRSLDRVYFLDKAGRVTEDATQAKSIYWAEPAKGGHGITYYQQPYDASQAYQQGDLVEKDGRIYRSNKNDNVWSPESRLDELWSEIAELEAEEKINSQLINYVNNNILPPSWWNK
jgi:hypothetical protein